MRSSLENGERFLDRYGWSDGEVRPMADKLELIAKRLSTWGVISTISRDLPPEAESQMGFDLEPVA